MASFLWGSHRILYCTVYYELLKQKQKKQEACPRVIGNGLTYSYRALRAKPHPLTTVKKQKNQAEPGRVSASSSSCLTQDTCSIQIKRLAEVKQNETDGRAES